MKEFELDRGEVELPHSAETLIVERYSTFSIFGKPVPPMFDRVVIMQPQYFHIIAP